MKRLEEAAVVRGLPAATGQTGPEHRKRVRPIVLIHLCRHRPRPLIRSESYESCLIQPRNPKTSSLQSSSTRPSLNRLGFSNRHCSDSACWLGGGQQGWPVHIRKTCASG